MFMEKLIGRLICLCFRGVFYQAPLLLFVSWIIPRKSSSSKSLTDLRCFTSADLKLSAAVVLSLQVGFFSLFWVIILSCVFLAEILSSVIIKFRICSWFCGKLIARQRGVFVTQDQFSVFLMIHKSLCSSMTLSWQALRLLSSSKNWAVTLVSGLNDRLKLMFMLLDWDKKASNSASF